MDEILRIQLRNNLTDDCNSVMIVEGGWFIYEIRERKEEKKERERGRMINFQNATKSF